MGSVISSTGSLGVFPTDELSRGHSGRSVVTPTADFFIPELNGDPNPAGPFLLEGNISGEGDLSGIPAMVDPHDAQPEGICVGAG